jgi:acetyltransferase-like isoleucine patch superfamily enzyme
MSEPKIVPIEVRYQTVTDGDYIGEIKGRQGFNTYGYSDGGISRYPMGFFSDIPKKFSFGKCSTFGKESCIRTTTAEQSIYIGRYVGAGRGVILLGGGFHEINTISTFEFGSIDDDMCHVNQREYGDIEIKNDVWIGDECMIMAGGIIENGCIIGARSLLPPRFKSEPFGIYAGAPAKLKKFRFSERVRELLLDIAWWDLPYPWIKKNNNYFRYDITLEQHYDVLLELKKRKEEWMSAASICVA